MTRHVIITTPGGEELVLVPRVEYEALMARASEDDDEDEGLSRLANAEHAAIARGGPVGLPADVAMRIIRGQNPLRVTREWKGLTQAELATHAATKQSTVSALEGGTRRGSSAVWRRLAQALGVPMETIMPELPDTVAG